MRCDTVAWTFWLLFVPLLYADELDISGSIQRLADADEHIRLAAASKLEYLGPAAKAAIPALIKALEDKAPTVRCAAADALRRVDQGCKESRLALLAALKDDAREVRKAVASTLVHSSQPSFRPTAPAIGPPPAPAPLSAWEQELVTTMIAALRDRDEKARRGAAEAFCEYVRFPSEAMPALLTALGDNNSEVYAAAVKALRRAGGRAIAPSIALLKDARPAVRAGAAQVLMVVDDGCRESRPALLELLKEKDRGVRHAASFALVRSSILVLKPPQRLTTDPPFVGPPKPLPAWEQELVTTLVAWLQGDDLAMRLGAAETFGAYEQVPAEAAPGLVAALGSDDPELRSVAGAALGHARAPAIRPLIAALKDGPWVVREAAARLLMNYGADARDAIPVLIAMLHEPDGQVRQAAMQVLGRIGADALPALRPELKAADPAVRSTAALAIWAMGRGGKDAVPDLVGLLADPVPQVREQGLDSLRYHCGSDPKALAAAGKLLGDSDPRVRFAAAQILRQVGALAKECVPALLELLKDESWATREAAVLTLQKIGSAAKDACPDLEIRSNEIQTVNACALYVEAQRVYRTNVRADGGGGHEYARMLKGEKDGLSAAAYDTGVPVLPPQFVEAEGEPTKDGPAYRGYRFKVLLAQGDLAPGGGKKSYILDGEMTQGHALVAYPSEYGVTGRKTFLVSSAGRIYEKDLSADTPTLIPAMVEFNPDPTWTCARVLDMQEGTQAPGF